MAAFRAFLIAGLLSLFNSVRAHAGVLVLFSGMFLYGAYWVFDGFRTREVPEVRFGLRVVGGFLFAFVLLVLDLILKLLGA